MDTTTMVIVVALGVLCLFVALIFGFLAAAFKSQTKKDADADERFADEDYEENDEYDEYDEEGFGGPDELYEEVEPEEIEEEIEEEGDEGELPSGDDARGDSDLDRVIEEFI